jgi:hypothetical protein
MATSLRQYTNLARVQSLAGDDSLFATPQQINLAEEMVDAYCAEYIRPSTSARFYDTESFVEAIFDGNNVTILATDESLETNYLKYCVLEIVESATPEEESRLFPIVNSHNFNLVIDNGSELTGQKTVKIYQLSKFPRLGDTVMDYDAKVMKTIPQDIRQAATYQAWFIINRPDLFDNSEEISIYNSESISRGGAHSYTGGSPAQMEYLMQKNTLLGRMISAEAKILLQKYSIQNLM